MMRIVRVHHGSIMSATGVRPWFKPFEVEWELTCARTGKKGGY